MLLLPNSLPDDLTNARIGHDHLNIRELESLSHTEHFPILNDTGSSVVVVPVASASNLVREGVNEPNLGGNLLQMPQPPLVSAHFEVAR